MNRKIIEDYHLMIKTYMEDILTFKDSGDYFNALHACKYCQGWIDAAEKLDLFDVLKYNEDLENIRKSLIIYR